MTVRVAGGLVAALGLATFAGEAAAQYSPQYSQPQSQYRGAPVMADDDDDDVPTYRVPAPGPYGRQPYPQEADRGPYGPDYRPRPPADLRDPYSPRYDQNPTAAIPNSSSIERRPYPPPPGAQQQPDYAVRPGQEPQPGYGVRQSEPQPSYAGRPAADPYYGRPPYDVPPGYGRPGQDAPGGYSGRPQESQPGYAGRPLPDTTPTARPPMDVTPGRAGTGAVASLPPGDEPETGTPAELPANLKRQTVAYQTHEPAGTIIIDTANTYLYLVLGNGQAMRYGIGVGREGFTWAGRERVSRMAEWPDWHPPAEMIERQPYLPRFMAGGEGNPLGARALYLGKTLYRIHGTNQPSTIGKFVSSGCVRLLNEDIEDLYGRVNVGSQVVVLPGRAPATAQQQPQQPTAQR
jgi:lipoprotein-anchoring transpeptidase ErfK/SrfK